ncbi:hypothetical protein H4P12_08320 [Paracoccus sp. 11-3]|uniref:Uncharacterized protein n=1 Tax=Paracoccus amoyensis TaxID=2760093 RepID=A0A926JB42_9RHOB|nr:hypothetical protein [Paracoccus amoyensis]MBC9246716.1 hypothetical protein [Paracoccus amoyensis]
MTSEEFMNHPTVLNHADVLLTEVIGSPFKRLALLRAAACLMATSASAHECPEDVLAQMMSTFSGNAFAALMSILPEPPSPSCEQKGFMQ